MKKTLGIIGGMGTFAGLRLAQHLAEAARKQGAALDTEYPSFLLFNLPIEGMDETGITNGQYVQTQLRDSLEKMDEWGCDFALIACNTAHIYFGILQQSFSGKLLNMVETACSSLGRSTGGVGVISSSTTKAELLYANELEKRNRRTILTTDAEQEVLDDAIKAVIGGCQDKTHFKAVHRVITDMAKRGADSIIIGCTELPLVIDRTKTDTRLVDAGCVTIEAVLPLLG